MPVPAPKDPESAFSTKLPPPQAPVPITPDMDPDGAEVIGLSSAEVEQFRESGYVIKRGLISPDVFAPIMSVWWQQPPVTAAGMRRDDKSTWVSPGRHWPDENRWGLGRNWMGNAPWPGPNDPRIGAEVGERVGRLPYKLTRDIGNDVWRWHGIGHDEELVAATSAHPAVLAMSELLMGGPVKKPYRNRGIYSVFPRDDDYPDTGLGPHMDQNICELMAVTYLQDVPPNSGGFTIYPGSAQRLYPTSEQAHNWVATDASGVVMDDIKTNVTPIEFTGKAGDVIFCHALTVHSAGIHNGDSIRVAVIQDFNKSRPRSAMRWTAAGKGGGERIHCAMDGRLRIVDALDDPEDGVREVTNQWIMDCNEFAAAQRPPFDDMFEEWNLGKHPVKGHVIDEVPWWARYQLPLLPEGGMPRGTGGTPAVALKDVADYEGEGCWCFRRF